MSLDLYFYEPADVAVAGVTREAIFIRENGAYREISRAEWDRRFPGREPITVTVGDEADDRGRRVYRGNVTHNLTEMADAARLYGLLWRPEENGITHARDLIEPLARGLNLLRADPVYFSTFDPPNGWGTYDGFIAFVVATLKAAIDHPDATVYACR